MIGRLEAIVIDVADLDRALTFWGAILGAPFGDSFEPQFRRATLASGVGIVLQQVAESKAGKNLVHIDLEAADLDAALGEIERLSGKRAVRVEKPGIAPHYVCADPDGNEFCLSQQA